MMPGASIINTTSIQTFQPGEELIAYAATKAVNPKYDQEPSQAGW
jgi:short-subunit dehydrogenase